MNKNNNEKAVYIIGDIHGAFGRLKQKVTDLELRDCYLLCVGDLGVGFKKSDEYTCGELNQFFANQNITFMSIRGNHDDPEFFGGKSSIMLSNFMLLPDYHTETLDGVRYLFVGGATSIDRIHRIQGVSWWPNEVFQYQPSLVTACDVLITHSAPSWNGHFSKEGIESWCRIDPTLWDECLKERIAIDDLIVQCGAKRHYCGHFHSYHCVDFKECYSTILDIEQIIEHREII